MAAAWVSGAHDKPIPWPLTLDRLCRRYNTLPEEGGILDQDDQVMSLMNAASVAYNLSKKRMKDFEPGEGKIYVMIMEILKSNG